MAQDSGTALSQVWQAKRHRLEEELLKLNTDQDIDREWQKHVSLLDRKLRSFVSNSARAARFSPCE